MSNPLLQRLAVMYGAPVSEDPAAWMVEAERLLKGYETRVLDEAFGIICRSHMGQRFPAINEIVSGCADAASLLYAPQPVETKVDQAWTAANIAKADAALRNHSLGRQAVKEGWGQGLHEFLRVNQRWPKPGEIPTLKANAAYVDRVAAGVEHLPMIGGQIKTLANSIIERRERLATRVLGEATE